MSLSRSKLYLNLPLNVLMKQDRSPMFSSEDLGSLGFGILVLRRPLLPDPDIRIPAVEVFVQRAMNGIAVKEVPLVLKVLIELGCLFGGGPALEQKLGKKQ